MSLDSPTLVSDTSRSPGANLLSALGTALDRGSDLDNLFSNALEEANIAEPPTPQPPSPPANPSSNPNASINTNAADNDQNDTAATPTVPSSSSSIAATNLPAIRPGWKHHLHTEDGEGRHKNKKDKSQAATDQTAGATSASTPANNQPAASTATPAPSTVASSITNSSATTEATTTATKTIGALDQNSATDGKSSVGTAASGTASSANATTDAANFSADANASSGKDLPTTWQILLMKLGQLVGGQNGSALTAEAENPSPAAQTSTSPSGASATDKSKGDLKDLLSELVEETQNPGTGIDAALTANAQTVSDQSAGSNAASSTNTSSASSSQNATTTSSDATKNAWMNADFFNLFNATPSANPSAATPAVSGSLTTLLNTTGGDQDTADMTTDDHGASSLWSHDASTSLDPTPLPLGANAASAANPYDFASQLSALREAKGGMTGLPLPAEQVILQIARGVKDGSSQLSIQLKPAELGRVDVKLNISSDGKVQGTVVASNPATLHLLLKDVRGLERALQEAGLRADPGSLQFSLANGDQSNTSSGQQMSGGSQTYVPLSNYPDTADALPSLEGGEIYNLASGRVNMRV
jgi:flagellar hook-length control protein FliK